MYASGFKHPLLSLDVDVCMYVAGRPAMSVHIF